METEGANQDEWELFGRMQPRMRPHVDVLRQHFRGELWYVLQNRANGRFHRLTPAAYQLVGRFDGNSSVAELLDNNAGNIAVDRDEAIFLVKQLFHSDLLQLDQKLPIEFYRKRVHAYSRSKGWRRYMNPMALKIPLFDPDTFLDKTRIAGDKLFSPLGLVIWLLVIFYAVGLAGIHWQDLTGNFIDRVLGTDNLVILFLVFPVIKMLHELGHGYAVKRWGGEVHEIGIMFLVFMPIPYVDASAATAYRESHRRMIVAAAGMMVEILLASLAMILWASLEPGIARAIAFNVIFLASVSTLLFNGNPLLRYDGYYILADFLEMPNLGPRSNKYIGYLIQRYLFRAEVEFPDSTLAERSWLLGYGLLSFFYRMFIWVVIILFVATKFFFFGVILAVWGSILMLLRPLYRMIKYLIISPVLSAVRFRAVSVTVLFVLLLSSALFLVPVPYTTLSEGVVWLPEGALIRAKAAGFIVDIEPEMNSRVAKGDMLIRMEDPLAISEVRMLKARMEELEAEHQAVEVSDRVSADVLAEHIGLLRSRLDKAQRILGDMIVSSPAGGRFVPMELGDLEGRYVQQGQVLGYVVGYEKPTIKTVVDQQDYLLVRERHKGIEARFVEDLGISIPLTLIQEVPAASDRLPSRALSQAGGGDYYLDPSDTTGIRVLQSHFEFELAAQAPLPTSRSGGRVFVRFDLGAEPVFWRIYRVVRQLFLREFSV